MRGCALDIGELCGDLRRCHMIKAGLVCAGGLVLTMNVPHFQDMGLPFVGGSSQIWFSARLIVGAADTIG